ncbi:hypothetical protein [Isoptericola sp. NPDC056134]|uniref:hypothetical protein n=1 Tax=Isoptericola sp. NPDC056134 TaxID=3345723 RepID=UPI0035EA72A1
MSTNRSRWRIVAPDGAETLVDGTLVEVCDQHDMAGCILAGCAEALGWTMTNLDTGMTTVPEDVDPAFRNALHD